MCNQRNPHSAEGHCEELFNLDFVDLVLRRKVSITEVFNKCYGLHRREVSRVADVTLDTNTDHHADCDQGMCVMGAKQGVERPSNEGSAFNDHDLTQIANRLRTIGDELERDFQEMAPNNSFLRDVSLSGMGNVRQLFRSAFLIVRLFAARFSWNSRRLTTRLMLSSIVIRPPRHVLPF
ncbi:hypothetical protein CAPTEDRAFT_193140 [Capitella teleta]|uniref:Uncharacterized protein n=1 Tax=Capitella teleta TaxID=283909 RepID=R7UV06_CAPTE|nr:hypothetical protein CAPTEDRAFT_193140 [Capitella teleta]|eukprot:ELU07772.1 hypothetical protein CAPTEDRAFT_193140 [Capitella teleta]